MKNIAFTTLIHHACALSRRCAAMLLCAAAVFSALMLYAPEALAGADATAPVSATEVPVEPEQETTSGEFNRVAAVPANIIVPDFYQEVINVSGMYIFTMPDGTVYKRIYGALDGIYGWYEPVGLDNRVPVNSPAIDTTEDALMYYAAVSEAEKEAMARQEYSGILPPDEAVTQVEELNGVAVSDVVFYCIAGAVALCLVITVFALSKRRAQEAEEYTGPNW